MKMNKLQVLAFLGIFGSIILYVGDQVLYYEPVSGQDYDSTLKMSTVSMNRLIIGGLMGPISSIFSLAGAYMLYLLFRKQNKPVAAILGISLGAFFIIFGSYHALFPNQGFAGRLPDQFQAEQLEMMRSYLGTVYLAFAIPLLVWTFLLFYFVVSKKSPLPVWILPVTPTILILLIFPLKTLIPYPLGSIIFGGWINITFIIFYILILVVARKRNITLTA
jgi:hypothetical protein